MIATFTIYLLTLALVFGAGLVATAALRLAGAAVLVWALPLGACLLSVVLHPISYALPMSVGAYVCLSILGVALIAVAGVLRHRVRIVLRDAHAALGLLVMGVGVVAGLLFLVPNLRLGFPTTIGISNNDGWARAVFIDWLHENPLRDSRAATFSERPLGVYSAMPPQLGAGFELVANLPLTLLGRPGYQVADAVAATAAPIAGCGWVALADSLGIALTVRRAAAMVAAVATPLFVLPLAEDWLTHMWALGLWPFAIAAVVRAARRASWHAIGVAALALGAQAAVYPPQLPWLALAAVAALLMTAGARGVMRTGPVLLGATALVALLPVVRAASGLRHLAGGGGGNPDFPSFGLVEGLAFALGGVGFSAGPALPSIAWAEWRGLTLLVAAAVGLIGVALAVAHARAGTRVGRQLLALLGAVVLTWVAIALLADGENASYVRYKSLISAGSILAGLLLLMAVSRPRWGGLASLALVVAWAPATAHLLDVTHGGGTGFRRDDVELGRRLAELPPGTRVLVEGVGADPALFHLRMVAGYFSALRPHVAVDGLGTTDSYITLGAPRWTERAGAWRPERPWDVVLRAGSGSRGARSPLWRSGAYELARAGVVDVSPVGDGWYPEETGFSWLGGPGDAGFLVASRCRATAPGALWLSLASWARPRRTWVRGRHGSSPSRMVHSHAVARLRFPVPIGYGVAEVSIRFTPPAEAGPEGDPRRLALRAGDPVATVSCPPGARIGPKPPSPSDAGG